MKFRALIAAFFVTAACFCCLAAPAVAAPALWVVQGPPGGGKVYLFGTVHLLRDGTQWRSPELEAAMKESQDLYLEVADPCNMMAASSSLLKAGVDREHPLSTKISKEDIALLDADAKRYGLGGEAIFEPMRPWLVYMLLSTMPTFHSGYSVGNGVDLQVQKEFAAAGKPIHGLETFDMQAHIFADLPESVQIQMLDTELKGMSRPTSAATSTAQLDKLVDAWVSGDEAQLAKALNVDKMTGTPLYAPLFTNRNKAWANVLAQRLKEPGTSFVSVGAGHLVGPDGVPALLAHMGYTVTRVPIAEAMVTAAPSPSPSASGQPMASPSSAPTSSPSATPIPQILTPPAGWKPRSTALGVGALRTDRMWVDPNHKGVLMSAHLDLPGVSTVDLNTLDALLHQGMVAEAGAKGVQPSTHVKICGGKQDATLTKIATPTAQADVLLAVSDRGYLAEYVHPNGTPEDPAAVRALFSLCAP
jgi:uncharacterized protein